MGEVQAENTITDFQQIDTIKSHQIGRDKQGSKWRLRRSQARGPRQCLEMWEIKKPAKETEKRRMEHRRKTSRD